MFRITCNKSMAGIADTARRCVGYFTYRDAHEAWDLFQRSGILPDTMPPISLKMTRHAEQLRKNLIADLEAAKAAKVLQGSNIRSPGSLMEGSSRSLRGDTVKNTPGKLHGSGTIKPAKVEKRPATPTPATRSKPAAPVAQSPPSEHRIWVVFEGPEPGVYTDR